MIAKPAINLRYFVLISGLMVLSLFALGNHSASAQNNIGSITASPAELLIEVAQRQPEQTKEITITNNYDVPITMGAELRSIDEKGGRLIPNAPIGEEVSKALKLSETDFLLPPRGSKVLKVAGTNNPSLGPGGHYATLVLTQRSSDNQQLSLRSAISINIFFIKADGARASVKLDSFKASNWLFHIASQANVTVSNDGNVRATPHGVVYVTDRHGELISQGVLNSGSQPLLPNKSLVSSVNLTRIQRVWYPQQLTFNISYRANDYDPAIKSYKFWYVPSFYLLFPLLLLTAIFLFFRKQRRKRTPVKKANDGMPKILKIAIRLYDDEPTKINVTKRRK